MPYPLGHVADEDREQLLHLELSPDCMRDRAARSGRIGGGPRGAARFFGRGAFSRAPAEDAGGSASEAGARRMPRVTIETCQKACHGHRDRVVKVMD